MSDVRRVKSVKQAAETASATVPAVPARRKHHELSESDFNDLSSAARDLQALLKDAVAQVATAVHIEPHGREVVVRYRVDGLLRPGKRLASKALPDLVARVKLLANLDVLEHRLPQDGRFDIETGGKRFSVRAALSPVADGEKIVLHVADVTLAPHDLSQLGFWGRGLATIQDALQTPRGLIIIGGPAGSGKTTTLYTLLHLVFNPAHSMATVEETIDRRLAEINQTPVNLRAGMTYASALRAVLRQDPNILMVSDVQEPESAAQTVQAALAGRLVFAGMHTPDVAASLAQLQAMRVEPYLLASTVKAIVNQRLVRRLCSDCRESYKPSTGEFEAACTACGLSPVGAVSHLAALEKQAATDSGITQPSQAVSGGRVVKLWRANPDGCDSCGHTGYKGRVALVEVLAMTPAMQKLVFSTSDPKALYDLAIADGTVPVPMDGFVKVALGETSMAEVLRAVQR